MLLLDRDKAQRLRLFGEDTCELVSTIEQSFGMRLTEDELVQAKTVGELAHFLSKKLKYPVTQQCLSAVMFYKLRRAFVELFEIPRARIAPATSLYEVMPWKTRKKQWREVQDRLNYALPQLTWPIWLLALSLLLVGSVLYFLFGPKMLGALGAASVLLGIIAVISVWIPILVVLNPLARQFPRSCETFGDLVKLALARNYAKIAATHGAASEKEVVQSLLQLIAAETAADVEKLSPDTLFPEGLHIY
jgi:hypothetical protein